MLPQTMHWIKVKDGLPEPYDYVLVVGQKEGDEPAPISIARQYQGKWEMLNHSDQSNAVAKVDLTWYMNEEEITHWMTLPSTDSI